MADFIQIENQIISVEQIINIEHDKHVGQDLWYLRFHLKNETKITVTKEDKRDISIMWAMLIGKLPALLMVSV